MEGDALELLRSNRLAVYFIHHTHTEVPTLESCPIEICDMLTALFPVVAKLWLLIRLLLTFKIYQIEVKVHCIIETIYI